MPLSILLKPQAKTALEEDRPPPILRHRTRRILLACAP